MVIHNVSSSSFLCMIAKILLGTNEVLKRLDKGSNSTFPVDFPG